MFPGEWRFRSLKRALREAEKPRQVEERRVRWTISAGALIRRGNQLPTPLETTSLLLPFS